MSRVRSMIVGTAMSAGAICTVAATSMPTANAAAIVGKVRPDAGGCALTNTCGSLTGNNPQAEAAALSQCDYDAYVIGLSGFVIAALPYVVGNPLIENPGINWSVVFGSAYVAGTGAWYVCEY